MRRYAALFVLVALLVVVAWWGFGRSRDATGDAERGGRDASATAAGGLRPTRRLDPATLERAAVAGTVRGERGPLAGVRVCVRGEAAELPDELLREPACATTDARGAYAIERLYPAAYVASAVLRGFAPVTWGSDRDDESAPIRLRAGERRTGIDFVLRPGGVELAGTVADLTGGPIDRAHVWVAGSMLVETDAKGAFSVWVAPGMLAVRASAEGYADALEEVWVPKGAASGAPLRVELVLTPEASVAGTVVDAATGEPVAGARVMVGTTTWGWDSGVTTFSDARGAFRVGGLIPRRYVVTARTATGFGRATSILVGLAQPVEGVVVRLHPAFRIDGRIVDAATRADCERGAQVSLQERSTNKFLDLQRASDGSHFADGVIPGSYSVSIYCTGARIRERYPPITITDRDALGLIWEVDRGATLRGAITARGAPVERATISAERLDASPRDKHTGGGTASRDDGSYELAGLAPGTYRVTVSATTQLVARDRFTIELAEGAVVSRDVELHPEEAGTIAGTIVDTDGRPVGGAEVVASSLTGTQATATSDRTGASGAFSLGPLRPGGYALAVFARDQALRKAGTTDDTNRGERVTVTGGQTSTVQLVVEAQTGTITGTVVDARGAAVGDAFVSAARESDSQVTAAGTGAYQTRWSWNERPVLTGTDGGFTLGKLSPGTYTIRAYRRGGGEAIVEHVALGGAARLTIRATAAISGRVHARGGAAPDELAITIRDLATGYRRREELYRTGGAYTMGDLPGGTYLVIAEAPTGIGQTELVLREGETRGGVDLVLDGFVTVTGRVVALGTGTPIAGLAMAVRRVRGGGVAIAREDTAHVSDAAGRFTVRGAPQGQVVITGYAVEGRAHDIQVFRTLQGSGTIDVGDIEAIASRLGPGELAGDPGLRFVEQPLDTPPDQREREIGYLDPAGPAARAGLQVGDVVIAIDGVDVRGEHAARAASLMAAPPGTRLVLAVARGVTATLVLAAP